MHQPEHTPRTLFVDDESINQQIGAEILLALGAEADTADNGLQALRLIRTRHYAIVFTDVEMPVMDGATLTHIPPQRQPLRRTAHHRPARPFLTGRGEALLQKGFTAVLRKPFDVQAMQTALNRHATLSGEAPLPHRNPGPASRRGTPYGKNLNISPVFPYGKGLIGSWATFPCTSVSCSISGASLPKPTPEIRQARLRDDMPSIRASVHKLKGISGNVGATDLYTQLVELEQCLQGGSAENVDNLLDTLYGYVTTAESVLAAAGQAIAAYPEAPLSIPAAGETLDVRKLQPALCECLLLIRQYNTAAREAFGSVRRFLGGQCGAEMNEIQHAIDTFDFEKAESGLLHLAQLLDLELREPNGLS